MNRFAPSTNGRAHPGTLLAGLLCWLDARSRGDRVLLRLEDLDPQRCTPALLDHMVDDVTWFGLEWDLVERQHEHAQRHIDALDRLASAGLLYPCRCSRARLRELGREAPDGGFAYDNACRGRRFADGWRGCTEAIRLRVDDPVTVRDEGGVDLGLDVAAAFGDPVVRRRDGALAYHLASVVDDAACGVDRVVRGRDLAPSTATQVAIQRALGLPQPAYRHHPLLLERRGEKLAKFHGSVGTDVLRERYRAQELCGIVAHACGLRDAPDPVDAADLVSDFAWDRLRPRDQILGWDGRDLRWDGDG